MKLVFTPLAEADVGEILDYVAEHRPHTARAVIARIREKCELLAGNPEIGQQRNEFRGNDRSFPVQRWVIFYRITRRGSGDSSRARPCPRHGQSLWIEDSPSE